MTKRYVLHHNDADGFGAAYAAYIKLGRNNVEYIAVDYGEPMPTLDNNSIVYILDFSYSRVILDELVSRMQFVLIIDHHKSAQENLKDHPNAIFDMNKSGAGLAWDYFNPDLARPEFINYIEDQDLGRFNLVESVCVRNSLVIIPHSLDAYIKAANVNIVDRINEGRILNKQVFYNVDRGFENVHVIGVDEFRMLAVNVCLHQSNFGTYLLKKIEEYGCQFAGVYYRLNQDKIKFSLRSIGEFDVSAICKRFGGGGHRNAAGFEVDTDKFNWHYVSSSRYPDE